MSAGNGVGQFFSSCSWKLGGSGQQADLTSKQFNGLNSLQAADFVF